MIIPGVVASGGGSIRPNPSAVAWTNTSGKFISNGGAGGTTGNIDASSARAIIVEVAWFSNSLPAEPVLSDSVGVINWTDSAIQYPLITQGIFSIRPYVVLNPPANAVSAAMTFTCTGTAGVTFPNIMVEVAKNDQPGFPVAVQQYSPRGYNFADKFNNCNTINNAASTDVAFAFFLNTGTGSTVAGDSFTQDQVQSYQSGNHMGSQCSHFVYSSKVAKTTFSNWATISGGLNDKCNFAIILQSGAMTPLRLTEFETFCIIPTDVTGGTTATPTFSGVYDRSKGTPASIEIQIEKADGTILQAYAAATGLSAGAGVFSCDGPTIPEGSAYVARCRTKDGAAAVLETSNATHNLWGVSTLTFDNGPSQSHMTKYNSVTGSGISPSNVWLRIFGYTDVMSYQPPAGDGYIAFCNALFAARAGTGLGGTDIPVLIVNTAVDGAGITTNGPNNPAFLPLTNYWNNLVTIGAPFDRFKTLMGLIRGKPNASLYCGGSSDAAVSTMTYGVLYPGLQTARANQLNYLNQTAADKPFFIVGNTTTSDVAFATDASWQTCLDTDRDFADNETNAYPAATQYDLARADTYHLTGPSYRHSGLRAAQSVLKFFGLQSNDGAHVSTVSASRVGAVITVALDLNGGTVLNFADTTTVGLAQAGWQVSSDNFVTPLTISSTAFTANQPVLTLSADPGVACKVRYCAGRGGSIDLTKIDYNNVFPQSDTLQIPIRPTSSQHPLVTA